jgi:hypothetical protein
MRTATGTARDRRKKIIAQIMFFSYKGGVSIGLIKSKIFNRGEYGV